MDILFLQASQPGLVNAVFLLSFVAIMYFFMYRPQAKKQKETANFQDELSKGDEVVTASGIIGKVNKIEENIVHLQVDQKTFIRVTKNAISKEMTEATFSKPKDA